MGRWQLNKKLDYQACWNCGNWVMTVIYWNQEIGIFNANNNVNITSAEKKRVIDKIRQHDEHYMSHEDLPMLFSNATNWKGVPFMRLIDWLIMCSGKPNFKMQALETAKDELQFSDLSQFRTQDERDRAK